MIQYEHLLVPIDFSDCAQKVLEYAKDFASRYGSTLHVLYVVEPVDTFATVNGVEQSVYFDMLRDVRENATQKLQKLVDEVKAQGLKVEGVVREGRPSDVIVDYAESSAISMICISTHGRSGLNHLLLGSTTERVLRKAQCPVFVVRCTAAQE